MSRSAVIAWIGALLLSQAAGGAVATTPPPFDLALSVMSAYPVALGTGMVLGASAEARWTPPLPVEPGARAQAGVAAPGVGMPAFAKVDPVNCNNGKDPGNPRNNICRDAKNNPIPDQDKWICADGTAWLANCAELPPLLDVNQDGIGDACDDPDADGVVDAEDNCPDPDNAAPTDRDSDGLGDACGNRPDDANPSPSSPPGDRGGDAGGHPRRDVHLDAAAPRRPGFISPPPPRGYCATSWFWKKSQWKLPPTVATDSDRLPGRKWKRGFFSIGSTLAEQILP